MEDRPGEVPAAEEGQEHRQQGPDQPGAQLLEVLEEPHPRQFLGGRRGGPRDPPGRPMRLGRDDGGSSAGYGVCEGGGGTGSIFDGGRGGSSTTVSSASIERRRSWVARRNSPSARPSVRPTSGSRLGPKTRRA